MLQGTKYSLKKFLRLKSKEMEIKDNCKKMTQVGVENTKTYKIKQNRSQKVSDQQIKNVQLYQNKDEDLEDFYNSRDYIGHNWGGKQPLHIAAALGRLDILKKLVENGANINAKTNKGWTPLQYATREGYSIIVRYLIKNNADIDQQDSLGYTSLIWATIRGLKKIVEYLCINNASLNIKNKENMRAIDYAYLYNDKDIITIIENYSYY